MEDKIKITYKGIEIGYNEYTDRWDYSVKGSNRDRETLVDAKKNIDEFLKKENKFERVEVYKIDYNKKLETVEVTSLAEERADETYWWTIKDGKREKTFGNYLFFKNEVNDKQLEILKELAEKKKNIQTEIDTEFAKMEKFTIKF